MKLFGGKLKTIIVDKFFDYCRRKSMARTCAGQILALGMIGDKSAVPARMPGKDLFSLQIKNFPNT
jgi:hypothetical protein